MTRWIRGPEIERRSERDAFDPVAVGARYQLSRDIALAIWQRALTETIDDAGRHDLRRAQQRFHDLAARIAARGGRLAPDVGKLTRVGVESVDENDQHYRALRLYDLSTRAPGRETLVLAESSRWSAPLTSASAAHRAAISGTCPARAT